MEMTSLSLSPFPRWLIMRPSENMKQGDEIGHGFFSRAGDAGFGGKFGRGRGGKVARKNMCGEKRRFRDERKTGRKGGGGGGGEREIPGSPSGLRGNPGSGLSGVKKRGEGGRRGVSEREVRGKGRERAATERGRRRRMGKGGFASASSVRSPPLPPPPPPRTDGGKRGEEGG